MKMAVICLVALILSGCAEYLQEVASRPAYQARWLATPGMTQQYPQNTSVNVCMGEANQARQQAYYAYLASSQNTSTAPTNHQLGSTLAAGIAARNAQTAANNAAANSYQIQLNACMNRSGYSLQNVCVKNCNTYKNSYQSQQANRPLSRATPSIESIAKLTETIGDCVLDNAKKSRRMAWLTDNHKNEFEEMMHEIQKRQILGESPKPKTLSQNWTENYTKYQGNILRLQDLAQKLRNYALNIGQYEDAEHLNSIVSCGGLSV